MLVKKKDSQGRTFYVNALTGKVQRLIRMTGKNNVYIPKGIYGVFRKPAMSRTEKFMMGL